MVLYYCSINYKKLWKNH